MIIRRRPTRYFVILNGQKNYQDHFFFKAKKLGYRSRSAIKLIELNEKFKFLKMV